MVEAGVAEPPVSPAEVGSTPPAVPSAPESRPAVVRPRRGRLRAVLVTLRPRQWLKNVLVVAAAGAAGALGHDDVPVRVGVAFIAFCLLASGIYAINDVRDVEEDRQHPRKRFRPIAAGELPLRTAVWLGVGLMASGLVICGLVRPLLAVVGAGYLVLTLTYSLVWRHLLVLDIVAIAGGFVLRAVAGGVAAPVRLSRWFLLVITFAAIFVAAGKRWAELRRIDRGLTGRRRVLALYTESRLRVILIASAAGAFIAYCIWAFWVPSVHGVPWRPLTIAPVALGLARYGALIRAGGGEAPEELVLRDPGLRLAALLWVVLFALGVHAIS
jgi:decaprenyl-phosphate phosphoribosyltransferase